MVGSAYIYTMASKVDLTLKKVDTRILPHVKYVWSNNFVTMLQFQAQIRVYILYAYSRQSYYIEILPLSHVHKKCLFQYQIKNKIAIYPIAGCDKVSSFYGIANQVCLVCLDRFTKDSYQFNIFGNTSHIPEYKCTMKLAYQYVTVLFTERLVC